MHEKNYTYNKKEEEEKKKIVCFLVFDNMFSTCFNEKGENTEKKNHIFVAPKQWNFFLYLCPPKKSILKKKKTKLVKILNN